MTENELPVWRQGREENRKDSRQRHDQCKDWGFYFFAFAAMVMLFFSEGGLRGVMFFLFSSLVGYIAKDFMGRRGS